MKKKNSWIVSLVTFFWTCALFEWHTFFPIRFIFAHARNKWSVQVYSRSQNAEGKSLEFTVHVQFPFRSRLVWSLVCFFDFLLKFPHENSSGNWFFWVRIVLFEICGRVYIVLATASCWIYKMTSPEEVCKWVYRFFQLDCT